MRAPSAIVLAGCGDRSVTEHPSGPAVAPAIARPRPGAPGLAPVNIGFLVSGDRTYANGGMIAVDETNADGGLLGRPVELMVEMGLEEAAMAVEVAETMILDDEVVALIGPNRSAHAIEVGAVAQRHGVPMITTAATNPGVTAAGDLVFMAAFTDQFQGRVMADFAFETLGVTTAAVLTQRGEVYSEGIGEFFVNRFRHLGGTVVADLSYERGATDFAAELMSIAAAAPAAVFMPGSSEEVGFLTAQARALPLHDAAGEPTVFLGADSWDNAALLENEQASVDGSFFSTHFSPDTDEPAARAFVEAYRARYGITPTGGDGVSYDAVRLFLQAATRAGTLDADAIRRELHGYRAICRSDTPLTLQRGSAPDEERGHHDHRERCEEVLPAGGSVRERRSCSGPAGAEHRLQSPSRSPPDAASGPLRTGRAPPKPSGPRSSTSISRTRRRFPSPITCGAAIVSLSGSGSFPVALACWATLASLRSVSLPATARASPP